MPAMPASTADKAPRLRELHAGPRAFVIANAFDAGSAALLAQLGFAALATSSGAAAGVLGRKDGQLSRDEALAHAQSDRRGDRAAGLGRSRERLRRFARRCRRDDPPRRRHRHRRRIDRGSQRRERRAAVPDRSRRRAYRGGRSGGAVAAVRGIRDHRAGRELLSRLPGPRRHDRAPEGVRGGRRRRAVRAGAARPRRRPRGLRGGDQAGQLHGRHEGQVVGPRHARGRRRSPRQPGDVAVARGDGGRSRRRREKCGAAARSATSSGSSRLRLRESRGARIGPRSCPRSLT